MFWDVVTLEENITFLHRIVTKIITEKENKCAKQCKDGDVKNYTNKVGMT